MRITATVTAVHEDGSATVKVSRRAACEGCHRSADGNCSVCTLMGGKSELENRVDNPVGAVEGDTVTVETASSRVMLYAFLVFVAPLLLAIGGYFGGRALFGTEKGGLLSALCLFALAFVALGLYSKLVIARRRDATIVEIVRRAAE